MSYGVENIKIITTALAAVGFSLAMVPAAADAQTINQRQANVHQRIENGARTGQLTKREAYRARIEYRSLVNREARYRRGGLTRWERQDLMRRYDMLSARVRYNKHDRQRRAPKWQRRR